MFRNSLVNYINSGNLSKKDFILNLFTSKSVFEKNSKRIIRLWKQEKQIEVAPNLIKQKIEVVSYEGSNQSVLKMMNCLQNKLEEDLFGAYLHGSLATQEEIRYSDFDALVILKDAVLEDEKRMSDVAFKLNRLQQIMHEFDPLQHHGWFVLTESMLKNYPDNYFPAELFKYSVSLLPFIGIKFDLFSNPNKTDFETPFWQHSRELENKMDRNYRPQNSFAIKSFLSEFMLLPSFYVQLKYKKAVYKKHSFGLARKDFSDQEWKIMDSVSEIRREWDYKLSPVQKTMLCHSNSSVRKLGRKYAPLVSSNVEKKLTDDFYTAISSLVLSMQSKIKSL